MLQTAFARAGLAAVSLLCLFCWGVPLAQAAFSSADLEGTWHGHSLESDPKWQRGTITVGADGTTTGTSTNSNGQPGSFAVSLQVSGMGRVHLPSEPHRQMALSKDILVGAGTTDDDLWLNFWVKQGAEYSLADLVGTWKGFGLEMGDHDGWVSATLTVAGDGTFLVTFEDSSGESDTFPGAATISSTGEITVLGTTMKGHLNASKNCFVSTEGSAEEPILFIFLKGGGSFSQADLTGTWQSYSLKTGSNVKWSRNTIEIDGSGSFLGNLQESDGNLENESLSSVTLSSSGQLSIMGEGYESQMSLDKNLIVHLRSDNGAYVMTVSIKVPDAPFDLVFPYAAQGGGWDTEIGVVRAGSTFENGILRGYDAGGQLVALHEIPLYGHGRSQTLLSRAFSGVDAIRYLKLETEADQLAGYTKFFNGVSRGAVPASSTLPAGIILVPHLGFYNGWWTGLGLTNTSQQSQTKTLWFNQGSTVPITLAGGAHQTSAVSSLFASPPDGLETAVLDASLGWAGLELFGSGNMLAGVRLSDETSTTLYYPHVAAKAGLWWTGVAAYNPPGGSGSNLTITAHDQNGTSLGTVDRILDAGGKLLETVQTLGFPENTAWIRIEASSPITGLELFGTGDGRQLAGFSVANFSRTSGIFPKVDDQGWTGVAFVNTLSSPVTVSLTGYDDQGVQKASADFALKGLAKVLGTMDGLFPGQDTSQVTHIEFQATGAVAGFQLNGSFDGWMLDALPALGVH